MRKLALFGAVLLLTGMAFGTAQGAESIPMERQVPRLVDEADLLTEEEEASLLTLLDEISERQEFDVCVAIVNSLDGKTASEYAADCYDGWGLGYGEMDDGILFLQCPADRDIAITTYGSGILAFTDAGQEYLFDQIRPYLKNETYHDAYQKYAKLCDEFLSKAKAGTAYDTGNLPKEKSSPLHIVAGFLAGLLGALFVGGRKKAAHKSVRRKTSADLYAPKGGVVLTYQNDVFLNRNLTTRAISQPKGGGSSTQTGSSGREHGGSSSKY